MLPGCSNHSPVLSNTGLPTRPLKRPFRFLTVSHKQDDFHTAVPEVWDQDIKEYAMFVVWKKHKLLEAKVRGMSKKFPH